MEILETMAQLEQFGRAHPGCVLSIGNFDGVHVGHQAILTRARQAARAGGKKLLAMTFEPHPVAVLYPDKRPPVLTPLKLKSGLLGQAGVDALFVVSSSEETLKLTPTEFVQRFLARGVRPSLVVEGEDFNFGYGRAGNVYALKSLGATCGFEVEIVEAVQRKLSIGQSVRISSTMIRNILNSGKVADAAVALGRPYRLIGRIVPGRGKGRELGFPTLNMEQSDQVVPAEGVYAGLVELGDSVEDVCKTRQRFAAVFSIGHTRTFGNGRPLAIESHLLIENAEDIKGRFIAMDFVEFIRGQMRFATEKELSRQIAEDIVRARAVLGGKR